MLNKLTTVLGPRFGVLKFAVAKRSPELLLVSGLVGGVASAIMLAKAHRKSEDVFEDLVEGIEGVQTYVAERDDGAAPITRAEETRMLMPFVWEGARRAVILYGPSVLIGAGSLALILASHGALKRRNKALMATVALLERGLNEYRKRVANEYGEDAEERLWYGGEARAVTTLTEGPDGKKKKTKSTKNHIPEIPTPLIYQRIFDETNPNWSPDPDMTRFFLEAVQRQMNDKYHINGYVMLNDVYRALQFAESPEGCVVGWSKASDGDGFISFGLDSDINMREGDHRFHLDFNVDGVVYDTIGDV